MANNLIENLKETFDPEIEDLGYELVNIEFKQEDGEFYLRFYIYNEDGIGLEDCEKVSRYLDERLDELDPINRQYFLEVSSPDLNRPIQTNDDLRRNLGVELTVNLYRKIYNKKNYEGILIEYTDDKIKLLQPSDEVIELYRTDISLIKVLLRF